MHDGSFKRVDNFFGKNIKVVCMWYIRLVYFLSMVFVCEFLLPSMGRPLVSKASCEGLPGEGRGDGGACLTAHYNSVRRFCSLCNSVEKFLHRARRFTKVTSKPDRTLAAFLLPVNIMHNLTVTRVGLELQLT